MPVLKVFIKNSIQPYETCYYLEYLTKDDNNPNISMEHYNIIIKLLTNSSHPDYQYSSESFLSGDVIEIGPRLRYNTPWCTNALEILNKSGISEISKIEYSLRYLSKDSPKYDKLTQQIYNEPPSTLYEHHEKEVFYKIHIEDIMKYSDENGLVFDQEDIEYYTILFRDVLKRNPTNVELFDLAQSNSEHSRHWFFKGLLNFPNDNIELGMSLFDMIRDTNNDIPNNNSLIAFSDNASCIRGYNINLLKPSNPAISSSYQVITEEYHPTLTAETHNFPTGICPFPGAATGTGGRIRDTIAIGRGGNMVAGIAGYCVGNLYLDNYPLPWEKYYPNQEKIGRLGNDILINASNGASDYGNKIGEPVILGFARTFGMYLDLERYEWIKPIMFSGGIGQMSNHNLEKEDATSDMFVVRVGGPAYPIGMGGGSASSRGQNNKNYELDYNAVQRGDPEMENRVVRFVRACSELGYNNPILSIHDQGSGGAANVTKEIVSPAGALINIDNIQSMDKSMSVLQKWCAEYQEQCTILIRSKDIQLVKEIANRENVPISFLGITTDTGKIQVSANNELDMPVNLPLYYILDNVPRKEFILDNPNRNILQKMCITETNVLKVLQRVLRLVSVGSKRFLTNKVDRSVTGLISQQQCVGPFQIPLSNYGIIAQSLLDKTGIVSTIGEQPIKGLINSERMAGMVVGEMLTNIIFAKVTRLEDIKCAGNWMWAPKLPGEGKLLYQAVASLCSTLKALHIGIDGGKDSLSMYVKDQDNYIKSPRTLVLSSYATTQDVNIKATPNFKDINNSIIFVDLGYGQTRLGGSAIGQVYNQVGDSDDCPEFQHVHNFKSIFDIIQNYLEKGIILSGHDRSDGGLITTLLEMSFASNIGSRIFIQNNASHINYLFNEELGLILEVIDCHRYDVINSLNKLCPVYYLGKTCLEKTIHITYNNEVILDESILKLRDIWEETSFNLELMQTENECVNQERYGLYYRRYPKYYIPRMVSSGLIDSLVLNEYKYKVGIIREDGSNGDKEMVAAFHLAGFEVVDISMNDLLKSETNLLDNLRGIIFVGGFSYSDVFGASMGWYSVIANNSKVMQYFQEFYHRVDTFSLGICNGCQLMSLLGWIPGDWRLEQNDSKRFESRFCTVKVMKSNSILLNNMENLTFGIWIAHGEGKFTTHQEFNSKLAPIRYVDDDALITEKYPFNPNGSPGGVTAICSENGRHLAMMPHPERSFLSWQVPWCPSDIKLDKYTPWFHIFKNAYDWCCSI